MLAFPRSALLCSGVKKTGTRDTLTEPSMRGEPFVLAPPNSALIYLRRLFCQTLTRLAAVPMIEINSMIMFYTSSSYLCGEGF